MKLNKLIITSVAGTTFMTLFSHIVSELEDENFSEPRLLGRLANRLMPNISKQASILLGWAAHYTVGSMFAAPYQFYLSKQNKKPTLINSLAAGAAGGVAGIAMWKATFAAHPAPPAITYRKFYTQLFFAHMVFGAVTGATLHLLNRPKTPNQENSVTSTVAPVN